MTGRVFSKAGLAVLALAVAACATSERRTDTVEVEIRGTDPGFAPGSAPAGPAAAPQAVVTGPGVVDYGDYKVAVAEEGDTVETLANRIGLSPAELGAYNGVQPSTALLPGDELVLPEGTRVAAGTPLGAPGAAAPADAGADDVEVAALPLGGDPAAPGLGPGPESTDGWSPALAAAAIDRGEGPADDGAPLAPPPSAVEPLPPAPVEPDVLSSPELSDYQTPRPLATPFELTRPVQGPVAVAYNVGATGVRNEGVDFAAAPGAPVVAAEDGEVALVSESLGGLGTIVLVRHPDDMMTVYGRLADVTVQKGDYLERGQRLGSVARAPAGTEARMHFEVRRGAESLDPMSML